MAIEAPARELSRDLSPVKSEAQMAPAILSSQTVDLNTSNAEMANPWHVDESNRLTIEAILQSGTWNTATALVRGSIDNATWTLIQTLTGVGLFKGIDITDYRFIQIRVGTLEGGTGVARFHGYGKVVLSPFDVTDVKTSAYTAKAGESVRVDPT